MAEVGAEIKFTADLSTLTKQIDDFIKNFQNKAKLQVDSLAKAMQKGVGSSTAGTDTGPAKNLSSMILKLGVISFALNEIKDLIGDLVKYARDASPILNASFQILDLALKLFFKPFGDFLGTLLRPLAFWLLRMAINFDKWIAANTMSFTKDLADKIDKFLNPKPDEGITADRAQGAGAVIGGAGGAIIGGIAGGIPGATIGAALGALVGVFIVTLTEGLMGFLAAVIGGLIQLGENLDAAAAELIGAFLGTLEATIGNISSGFIDGAQNALGIVGAALKGVWISITGFVSKYLSEPLTAVGEAWKIFLTGLTNWWDTNIKPILDGWIQKWNSFFETTIRPVLNGIGDAFNSLVQGVIDAINGIIDYINKTLGPFGVHVDPIGRKQAGSDFISEEGMYYLHRGEKVMNATSQEQGSSSVSFSPSITVNASVSNNMDLNTLANQLVELMNSELRRKVSYGRGFS